jgi:excisionase family DNA binding protein
VDPGTPKLLLSVEEVQASLEIGRAQLFALLMSGEIASFRVGRYRKIPVMALEGFIERRCAEVAMVAITEVGVEVEVGVDG